MDFPRLSSPGGGMSGRLSCFSCPSVSYTRASTASGELCTTVDASRAACRVSLCFSITSAEFGMDLSLPLGNAGPGQPGMRNSMSLPADIRVRRDGLNE